MPTGRPRAGGRKGGPDHRGGPGPGPEPRRAPWPPREPTSSAWTCAADLDAIPYPLARPSDLDETVRLVEATGARMVAALVDVRDAAALTEAVERRGGPARTAGHRRGQRRRVHHPTVGRGDPRGVGHGHRHQPHRRVEHLRRGHPPPDRRRWRIDDPDQLGGRPEGQPFLAPYVASKHGMVGIMRMLANELASQHIRVNSIHPTGVDTPMLVGLGGLTERIEASPDTGSALPQLAAGRPGDPGDVSEAVLYLSSDESRYVTGLTMTVDAGVGGAGERMSAGARYRHLFTPLRLGPVAVPNRIVFSAHLTNYATDGLPTEQHAAYYARPGRRRGRPHHHRGALDPPAPTGPTRSSSTASIPRSSRATGASPTRCTPTTCRSSPRSTTTAARPRACTRACRCGRPARCPTRCSARCPRRSRPTRSPRSSTATPRWPATAWQAGSTASSCSARTPRSCGGSCRRPPTGGPTSTAGSLANRARLLLEIVDAVRADHRAPTGPSGCGCAATS